jgi:hypothetical protein
MTITLLPRQQKAIEAAIQAGVIHSVEEFLDSAIATLPQPESPGSRAAQAANLVELFEPIRGLLTDVEVDTLFIRNPSTGRPVDLT